MGKARGVGWVGWVGWVGIGRTGLGWDRSGWVGMGTD